MIYAQQESGARSRYPAVGRPRALQAPRELPGSGTCIFPKLRAEAELSAAFGRIFNADQVLFNSVPIGAEGHIGEQAIEAEAHAKTRVYRVPRNAIHYGSDNVLAVRVKKHRHAGCSIIIVRSGSAT
jgi:hypothetical protein